MQRGRDERERIAGRDAALIAAPQDEVSDIEVIRLLIAELPPRDREVIQLTYWDRLTAAEVAVAVGSTTSAVWKRISRAKTQLKAGWAEREATEKGEMEGHDEHASNLR